MVGIFSGLTRGVPGIAARDMAPPASTFEAPQDILKSPGLAYAPDRLFLGLVGATMERDKKTNERFMQGGTLIGVEDDRHAITIAGTRAGKGRAAIIPNMLRYRGSVLAIDPKGELADLTANRRAKDLKQRVCVVDPFGTTKNVEDHKAVFNPLAGIKSPDAEDYTDADEAAAIEDAVLITDALVVSTGNDPHWDESARTFIEGVILEVVTAERFAGRRDLVTVRDLIAQGDSFEDEAGEETGMNALKGFMKESSVAAVRRAAADFFDRPEKERDSVLSTARRHLRALAFPEIERSLRGEGFNLSELKTGSMTVYLCLPGRHMGTCGRWLRLFVNLALQAMERTTAFEKARPGQTAAGCPTLFVLDEFATLGHMRQIEDAAGQIAGFGVKLWPILQDLGQLKALYKDRWETFMGNAGTLQFFGNNDLTTLEYISKRLGSTTIEQLSKSDVTPGTAQAGGTGESYAPRTTPLLEPDEISMLFGRNDPELRQLIIRAGLAPMILQKAYHDQHDAFKK